MLLLMLVPSVRACELCEEWAGFIRGLSACGLGFRCVARSPSFSSSYCDMQCDRCKFVAKTTPLAPHTCPQTAKRVYSSQRNVCQGGDTACLCLFPDWDSSQEQEHQ